MIWNRRKEKAEGQEELQEKRIQKYIRVIGLGVAINMPDHLSHAGLIAGPVLFVCSLEKRTKQVPETSLTCP